MSLEIFSPSDSADPTKPRRSKDGRPYVKFPCPDESPWSDPAPGEFFQDDGLCRHGRVSGKREGTTKQCPTCKGKGYVEKLYTRCTSFVGVLDDRSNLEAWQKRIVLVGLGVDQALINELDMADPDDRETLDSIADKAFRVGEGHAKAEKGTDLHYLAELIDAGRDLPTTLTDQETGQVRPVTLQDRADLAAWRRTMDDLATVVIDAECFVVQDDYEIGGTYDRKVGFDAWSGTVEADAHPCPFCELPMILDLKTGRIDYGAGKMAQQLAVYANSDNYDAQTGERTKQDVCTHFGIIVHLPQGTGEATVHVLDLVAGWEAVKLSSQVREYRRASKGYIWPLENHAEMVENSPTT